MRHSRVAIFVAWTLLLAIGCAPREETNVQGSSVAADLASAPTTAGVSDSALSEKRIEYRDAMRQLVEFLQRRYMDGLDSIHQLVEAQAALLDAELAISLTQEERLAALEASLEKLKELEQHQEARIEVGSGRTDEMAKAKAARLHGEILLLKQGYPVK